MIVIYFGIFCFLFYKLGVILEREKWIYHKHFLDNGVAKCYNKGRIEKLGGI